METSYRKLYIKKLTRFLKENKLYNSKKAKRCIKMIFNHDGLLNYRNKLACILPTTSAAYLNNIELADKYIDYMRDFFVEELYIILLENNFIINKNELERYYNERKILHFIDIKCNYRSDDIFKLLYNNMII